MQFLTTDTSLTVPRSWISSREATNHVVSMPEDPTSPTEASPLSKLTTVTSYMSEITVVSSDIEVHRVRGWTEWLYFAEKAEDYRRQKEFSPLALCYSPEIAIEDWPEIVLQEE